MIHAYNDLYLERAQDNLAEMLDYATEVQNLSLEEFFSEFIASSISREFGKGDFHYLAGMSGIELCFEVLDTSSHSYERRESVLQPQRSKSYWIGWALAYYQWYCGLSFAEIASSVPILDIEAMYSPYHEMDIQQFCDEMDRRVFGEKRVCPLKFYREREGLSQSGLSQLSSVPVRTIQEYEQGRKDLGKAQAEYLFLFSKILDCCIEDLLKTPPSEERGAKRDERG